MWFIYTVGVRGGMAALSGASKETMVNQAPTLSSPQWLSFCCCARKSHQSNQNYESIVLLDVKPRGHSSFLLLYCDCTAHTGDVFLIL